MGETPLFLESLFTHGAIAGTQYPAPRVGLVEVELEWTSLKAQHLDDRWVVLHRRTDVEHQRSSARPNTTGRDWPASRNEVQEHKGLPTAVERELSEVNDSRIRVIRSRPWPGGRLELDVVVAKRALIDHVLSPPSQSTTSGRMLRPYAAVGPTKNTDEPSGWGDDPRTARTRPDSHSGCLSAYATGIFPEVG